MSFYISLSGLKGAQADLSAISNNVANVNSTAFKKSKAQFGDIFAAAPMQTTHQVAGQGVRVQGISQQFTQGTIETTDKTLDMAITGEGFFTVKAEDGTISYTRNGAFSVDDDRYALDTTGARMQVFPVDPDTGVPTTTPTAASTPADLVDLQVPTTYQGLPDGAQLTSVGVAKDGLVSAIYADGSTVYLGQVAMASFNSLEGLRQQGDHRKSALVRRQLGFGKNLESQRLQCIADQQGGRLVVFDMAGRPAAPQHVVVHAGQIVMDQRIGMDQFDGTGGCIDLLRIGAECLTGGMAQQWTHTLAATERAVTHRCMQAHWRGRGRRQPALQRGLGAALDHGHPGAEIAAQLLGPSSAAFVALAGAEKSRRLPPSRMRIFCSACASVSWQCLSSTTPRS